MNKTNLDIRQKHFTALDTLFTDGSMPISFQKQNEDWTPLTTLEKYDSTKEVKVKLDCFRKIIAMCQEKNIQLILIVPPLFDPMNSAFKERLKEVTQNKIPFFEYNNQNPIYKSKNYYYDRTHLNFKGAKIFTDEIANYLKTTKALN